MTHGLWWWLDEGWLVNVKVSNLMNARVYCRTPFIVMVFNAQLWRTIESRKLCVGESIIISTEPQNQTIEKNSRYVPQFFNLCTILDLYLLSSRTPNYSDSLFPRHRMGQRPVEKNRSHKVEFTNFHITRTHRIIIWY